MHQKMRNLIKMWEEKGYQIKGRTTKEKGKDLVEVKLSFKRLDGQSTILNDEWDTLKSLASRQFFYILPVTDGGHSGIPEVVLVLKSLIYQVQHKLQDFRQQLKESYWGVQGDEEIEAMRFNLDELWKVMVVLNQDVRKMKTMNNPAQIRHYFEHCRPSMMWWEYIQSVRETLQTISDSEKITDETKESFKEFMEMYAY